MKMHLFLIGILKDTPKQIKDFQIISLSAYWKQHL